jgi:hypothetical protein
MNFEMNRPKKISQGWNATLPGWKIQGAGRWPGPQLPGLRVICGVKKETGVRGDHPASLFEEGMI